MAIMDSKLLGKREFMISKQEIINRADITSLHPHVIEKNYALGWLLAGIFNHRELKDNWIFKGGTCIKKCYFETYRFSEDLDFTLKDDSHLSEGFLKSIFGDISHWIEKESGLSFPSESHNFEIYKHSSDQLNCEGKISYLGPVSPTTGGLPKIKLDLTANELICSTPIKKKVFHPYSDNPEGGIQIMSYIYEEVFAEKIRALAQRANPRDLYDVVNLYRNPNAKSNISLLKDILKKKCKYKGIPIPTLRDVVNNKEKISSSWKSMLDHQLSYLPPVEHYWEALTDFFNWMADSNMKSEKTAIPLEQGQVLVTEPTLDLSLEQTKIKRIVENIRFASTNHLCVKIKYQDSEDLIEAYALRKKEGLHYILYTWDIAQERLRTYLITRIKSCEITDICFNPRYKIDLIPRI